MCYCYFGDKMKTQFIDGNLVITDFKHINIPLCLDCGQAFRWKEAADGLWQGIAYGKFLSLKQEENKSLLHKELS